MYWAHIRMQSYCNYVAYTEKVPNLVKLVILLISSKLAIFFPISASKSQKSPIRQYNSSLTKLEWFLDLAV